MGIYRSTQIQAAIEDGTFVCVPFHNHRLSPGGLQLTLGSYYYRTEQAETVVHDPFSTEDNEHYLDGPFRALTHERQCTLSGLKPLAALPAEASVILLRPGERIVAHTHEFIGILPGDKTHLEELPGWHQNGVAVTPNYTEVAGVMRLSLVIHNGNARKIILLPVGAPIAQLVLYRATRKDSPDQVESPQTHLETSVVDAAVSTWTPGSILADVMPLPAGLPTKIVGISYE